MLLVVDAVVEVSRARSFDRSLKVIIWKERPWVTVFERQVESKSAQRADDILGVFVTKRVKSSAEKGLFSLDFGWLFFGQNSILCTFV